MTRNARSKALARAEPGRVAERAVSMLDGWCSGRDADSLVPPGACAPDDDTVVPVEPDCVFGGAPSVLNRERIRGDKAIELEVAFAAFQEAQGREVDVTPLAQRVVDCLSDLLGPQSPNGYNPSTLTLVVESFPMPTAPERRRTGIMPAPFGAAVSPERMQMLPALPGLPGGLPGEVVLPQSRQSFLPGMEPAGHAMPAVLLAIWDRAGGLGRRPGPGATLAMHLFIECLLSVPVEARTGALHQVGGPHRLSVREIVRDWNQWDPKHYRPTGVSTGRLLQAAFLHMRDIAIPVNRHGGFFFPVLLEAATGWRLKDRIALLARIPEEGRVGPSVDREMLRLLRPLSEPSYRAYLSLCFDWDKYGATTNPRAERGKRRRLIRPTRPQARRNRRGHLLDAQGNVITGKQGPEHSPYHPRAILTGARELNPARTRYPERDADDLVRLCFPLRVYDDSDARRSVRSKARKAVELIERQDGCYIEKLGANRRDGHLPWRIMPPDPRPKV